MPLLVNVDRSRAAPLQDQIYEQIRDLIVTGRLKVSARMAATRLLAEQLGVSRNTVVLAYERLIAEGYLETSPAFGTFVSGNPPKRIPGAQARSADARPANGNHGSHRQPFASPDPQLFPTNAWRRLLLSLLERNDGRSGANTPNGHEALQQSIAAWLGYSRGIAVSPQQAIVVAGRHQAYDIAARLLVRRGSRVVVEAPGFPGAARVFGAMGAELVPVEVDEHGIDAGALPAGQFALAHVTPGRQYPIGGMLPQARRDRLVAWAHAAGARIIEDDCDGTFHYNGAQPAPLKSQDRHGLVFYMGSFANALGPQLSLGYVVPPPDLLDAARDVTSLLDNGNCWMEQLALANFIDSGGYGRHLLQLRKVYLARRNDLIESMRRNFGNPRLVGTENGTYVTWILPEGFPPAAAIERLAEGLDIRVRATVDETMRDGLPPRFAGRALFIGYSTATQHQIRQDVASLAAGIAKMRENTDTGDIMSNLDKLACD